MSDDRSRELHDAHADNRNEVCRRDRHKNSMARVGLLAEWLERDRRESDKVLMYAQELANLATAWGGGA